MTPVHPSFFPRFGTTVVLAICMATCLLVGGACAADAYYTGYLGDVIDLHGSSSQGTQVYLFMTGPGLPTDGVTLTDISQRADQGQFTVVDLDSSGQWSMQWDTSRLAQLINPGTYTVYVTQKPVDYSHLGSSDTYKTLSVYLQDAGTRTGSISSYTLHLDDSGTTVSPTPTLSAEIPTPTFPVAPPEQPTVPVPQYSAAPPSAETTPSPVPLQPLVPVIAVLACAGLAIYRSGRR
ncbi:MAG: hypothetical protein WAK75_03630 [Methanoregula sp.]|uniref:hypothetical protein n=2 Tax=Methanoregula sp. TaxID=2052170 RepID=UPI003BB21CBC